MSVPHPGSDPNANLYVQLKRDVLLAPHEDRAFKPREITSQIGIDEGAVSTWMETAVEPIQDAVDSDGEKD